jgi:TRAP-type C4-dicarboxylate transport system permease small subunit
MAAPLMSPPDVVAAALLAVLAALTFVSVIFRYVLTAPLPDAFDISRLLLGAALFWGMAAANARMDHVRMDVLWSALSTRGRKVLDGIAGLVTFGAFALLTVMFFGKVADTWAENEQTADLRLPVAAFYALAALGLAVGAVLPILRLAAGPRRAEIAPTASGPAPGAGSGGS